MELEIHFKGVRSIIAFIFKKKNTQQFIHLYYYLSYCLYPLVSENGTTNENNSRQTVVEHPKNTKSPAVHRQILKL